MAVSDPIADFLTKIRNAARAQHHSVDIGYSKIKEHIAEILKEQGFIENYLVKKENGRGTIRIFLKYTKDRNSIIQGIRRISKPGLRKYVGHEDIPHFYGGYGLSILSTSQGLMGGSEATKRKIGGELLCTIW